MIRSAWIFAIIPLLSVGLPTHASLGQAVAAGTGTAAPPTHEEPAHEEPAQQEPTHEGCLRAVANAKVLAQALPPDDPSRAFAISHLHQALVEDGNGEYDDCLEQAEMAVDEVTERRHVLRPGEKLDGLGLRN